VPFLVSGPGIARQPGGVTVPTSHVDLIPTLMGLAGIDVERATAGVAAHHDEAQPLPGRDLRDVLTGRVSQDTAATPIYFMTEDNPSKGSTQVNLFTGATFEAVGEPTHAPTSIESVLTTLATGPDGRDELWKLNHYYERLDDWNQAHGIPAPPFAGPAAQPLYELHNLTADPEERHNRAADEPSALSALQSVLEAQREAKRLVPSLRNPA